MTFLFEQMQWIYFLQQFRNPFVDKIFWFLNFFDTDYFICSLVVFIWIGFSWRWGIRFAFLMIASGWINSIAKIAFSMPRPFFWDPSVAIVKVHDYGFPSGGAQFSMLLACFLIYFWKSRWSWPLGIFYLLLISFSRIFLGVHFPIDVLGGWILGALLFAGFITSYRPLERVSSRFPLIILSLTIAIALILGLAFQGYKATFLMVTMIFMPIGVYFSTKFQLFLPPSQNLLKSIGLGFFGIFSSMVLTALIRVLISDPVTFIVVQGMISSLWISLLISPLCKKLIIRN